MPDLIITPPTAAGSPTPTVTLELTRDGADVLGEVSNGQIIGAAPGVYSATWTATNGVSPDATVTRTVTVEAPDVPMIGGAAIGSTGATGTIYEGFRLIEGDDFEAEPTRWSGRNLNGRYTHSILHAQHIRRTSTPTDRMIYMDPTYRGPRHESPVDLGYDGVVIENGIAAMTASPRPDELVPFLPATYDNGRGDANDKPLLISGSLKTSPSFMLSALADFVIEAKVRLQGGNIAGYWPSFWTTTFFWPDFAEIDVLEAKKSSGGGSMTTLMNFIHSDVDGQGPAGVVWRTEAQPTIPANRWVKLAAKRINDTLEFWDDIAQEGVMALRVTVTDATRVQRMRGAHDVRLDLAVSTNWDSSTFDIAHWPAKVEFDYWRAWVPATAARGNEPLVVLPPVYTTPGGSWGATFPSKAEMFGTDAGLEQVIQAWDGPDGPGRPTRSNVTNLSTTLAVDLTARTAAGTVPTTEGGATGLFFTYAYEDGSPAKRVLMPYYVAPAVQSLPTSWPVEPGAAIDITIPYTAFHSGNLGPHSYTVTAPGLTVTGNGTTEVQISGTAGADGQNVEVTIAATNIEGQTTTTTRTVIVADSSVEFHPSQLASVLAVVDPMQMDAFTDVAGTTPATVGSNIARIDTKGVSFTQATASKRPQLLSDGTRQYVQSDGTDLLSAATRLGLAVNPALEISASLRVLSSQIGAYSAAQIGDAGVGVLAVGGGSEGWSWRHNNGAAIFQTPPVNTDRVVSWRRPAGGDYNSETFISSGAAQTRVSVINPTNVPTSAAEAAHLFGGVNSSGDASLNARYYGLVISSGATAAELEQIDAWLKSRAGIA